MRCTEGGAEKVMKGVSKRSQGQHLAWREEMPAPLMGLTCQAQRQGSKAVEVKLMPRSLFGLPLILTGVHLLEHLHGFLHSPGWGEVLKDPGQDGCRLGGRRKDVALQGGLGRGPRGPAS